MNKLKAERAKLREKFGGRCAYCGNPLGERWHADHLKPVMRELVYVSGKGAVSTGKMWNPENHNADNMMPACAPCNIDKHSMSLESWRQKLHGSAGVLTRNSPTYRHAKRFGLIVETEARIEFYFERYKPTSP